MLFYTHFQGRWDIASPEAGCVGPGEDTDQTRAVPVSCEVGDGGD